jgi:hypothetical protein
LWIPIDHKGGASGAAIAIQNNCMSRQHKAIGCADDLIFFP